MIGQLLVESLVLASIERRHRGGYWGKQLLPSTTAQTAPLDWRVLAFVTLITAITGILFGIAPAFRATSGDVSGVLKSRPQRGCVTQPAEQSAARDAGGDFRAPHRRRSFSERLTISDGWTSASIRPELVLF